MVTQMNQDINEMMLKKNGPYEDFDSWWQWLETKEGKMWIELQEEISWSLIKLERQEKS